MEVEPGKRELSAMNKPNKWLRCQWCGAEGLPECLELDEANGDGFWCPDCDGHTYYDEERNKLRRILLILENKDAPAPVVVSDMKLKKRMSPLRYPGGKSKLIDYLSGKFRNEQMQTFVETFAGGASVGLALLDAGLTKHLVLNDTDPGVYAFWAQVVSDPSELLKRLSGRTPGRADYQTAKGVLDEPKYWNQSEIAWSQLLVNRLSFSGISKACAMGGKNGREEQFLSRWNPAELKRRIERIHAMADHIEVTCLNAEALIETSAYWDGQATLFVDPPYVKEGKRLYRRYFDEEDHRQLAWLIEALYQGMPGADIIITYDDCELIRSIYHYADTVTIGRNYSICKQRTQKED